MLMRHLGDVDFSISRIPIGASCTFVEIELTCSSPLSIPSSSSQCLRPFRTDAWQDLLACLILPIRTDPSPEKKTPSAPFALLNARCPA